jgi:hypothetical protein
MLGLMFPKHPRCCRPLTVDRSGNLRRLSGLASAGGVENPVWRPGRAAYATMPTFMPRRIGSLVATSALLLAATPAALAQSPAGAPREVAVDLGTVAVGTPTEATCGFTNPGDGPLKLTPARVPRGLTVASHDATVAPGARGVVRLVLDTFQPDGPVTLTATFATNRAEDALLACTVTARIRHHLAVTPPTSRFNFVRFSREGATTHLLTTSDGRDVDVVGVESPYPWLHVSWQPATPEQRVPEVAGRQWLVTITIARDAAVGPIAGHVVVRTTHPDQPAAWIPVSGFVRPVFAVTPPTLELGTVVPSDLLLRRVQVQGFAEPPVQVTGAAIDVTGLEAVLRETEPGRRWIVEVRAGETLAAGAFTGRLVLKTTSADVPEVVVPVSGERPRP